MFCTRYIPKERFSQFHEVLCSTGGRYLRDPFPLWETIEVHYEPGDETEETWNRYNTPIREKMSNQWWRIILRRLGISQFG